MTRTTLALLLGLAAMPAQAAEETAGRYHSVFMINDRPQAVMLLVPGEAGEAKNRLRLAFGAPRNCTIDFDYVGSQAGTRSYQARQASPGSWCERQSGDRAELRILSAEGDEITYEFRTARVPAERHVGVK
ncbi:hypothetical protein P7L66_02815 (plasmid) [Tistrella mobilis]|uniref:hypothetical protein n=1 Tax=Tistrella mobilis TaxID=171437 RepID=UPI003557B81F